MKNTYMFYRIAAFAVVIGLLIVGCGSSPQPVASGADELDAAIREASDYLNTRIPNGNKVAFINVSGGFPDLADYILSDLSKHGVNDGIFSVVDRALLDQVREELNFNISGEVSDSSAQAIGQMLGAQTIVSGSVRKIGTSYRLDVKAIEVQTAGVQGQWNRNIPIGATIAALTVNTSSDGIATASGSGGRITTEGGNTTTPTRSDPVGVIKDSYDVGDIGPAGGFIFYDKGNNSGGWRYLEAAPVDLGPAIFATEYMPDDLFDRIRDENGRGIGKGKFNTEYLMEYAQSKGGGFGWVVQLVNTYRLNGFSDWFLPSRDEMNYMYGNLYMRGIGNLRPEKYWTSTGAWRNGWYNNRTWVIDFSNNEHIGGEIDNAWDNNLRYRIRPIRQF
jgi:hypothetical protein